MPNLSAPNPSPVVSVRVTPSERDLLEIAAGQARTSLSDFMRRKSLEAAEMDVLDQRAITIPAENWERVEAWIGSPAREIPALQQLAASRPAWQD